jgi:hypothetical protein
MGRRLSHIVLAPTDFSSYLTQHFFVAIFQKFVMNGGVTHVHGHCQAKDCRVAADAACQQYDDTGKSLLCGYCGCHRSAHHRLGMLVGDAFHPGPVAFK